MAYVTSGGCMILPLLNNNCNNTDNPLAMVTHLQMVTVMVV